MKILKSIQFMSLLSILFLAGCHKDDNPSPAISPAVHSTTPANNAVGIPRNNAVTIEFTEAMDPATINSSTVIVKQNGTVVPGVVTYTGMTATFTPTDPFLALTAYTITVTTGAKTMAGKPLTANVTSTFTTGGASSTLSVVGLGSAINYVILAKSAINNSSTSAVTGDLGISPAAESYITGLALTDATGYATSVQVTGKVYAADMAAPTPTTLTTSVNDMLTAYTDAAGRALPDFLELGTGNIGGKTLTPGLYKWTGNVTIPATITLSGGANDVWIFQIAGNLSTASAVNMILSGGAQAKNIFWQVAGEATFGTTSHVVGVLMSKTAITFQTGSSLNGRALAQTSVVLDASTITQP